MLDIIMGIASSSGLGVIAGLVGSYFTKREERKLAETMNAHERDMAAIDAQRDAADQSHSLAMADKKMDLAQIEGEIASDVAEMDNIAETIKAQSIPSGNQVIDGILRFVRPLITIYLLVILTIITYKLHVLTGGLENLKVDEIFALYKHIIHQTVFLAVTAVAWWFGSRGAGNKAPK